MKHFCIPMSVLLISLSGHDANANIDDVDNNNPNSKVFTKELKQYINLYDLELSIFSEKGYTLPLEILERIGDQDVVGRLNLLRTQDGKRECNRKFSEQLGEKPALWRSKKVSNLFKKIKMKFLFNLAREKSYQSEKEIFKLVLRSQENTAE